MKLLSYIFNIYFKKENQTKKIFLFASYSFFIYNKISLS